jgi:gas vesicle protein
MKTGTALVGILAGVTAGAIIGVLFAPDKGSKTRKLITGKSKDYASDLKEQFNDLVDSVTNKAEKTRQDAEILAANGKAKYEDLKK